MITSFVIVFKKSTVANLTMSFFISRIQVLGIILYSNPQRSSGQLTNTNGAFSILRVSQEAVFIFLDFL